MTNDQASSVSLRVAGMHCANCAATVEKALRQVDGVGAVNVDVMRGHVRIEAANAPSKRRALEAAVASAGYAVVDDRDDGASESSGRAHGRLVAAILSGVALGLALMMSTLAAAGSVRVALLALSATAAGWYVIPRGVRAALNRALDMNFLMSVAAAGAWIIGERTEAAATLFLFAIAELLETMSMDRARHAIRSLMELSPAEASVLRNGAEQRVPASDVLVDEFVLVRPGGKVPVDGLVTDGASSVNEAPITGESLPVDKAPGATVFAGTLNINGVLTVRATKHASDTTLARIIHAVEEAQSSRAPSQTFVDRFARVYTPIVVGVALLIAVGPPLLGVGAWADWIYRALTMLVVACPCALVISTPVALVSGLTGAARTGILIKGGRYLEALGSTSIVAFDKTGTLTKGTPVVTDIVALGGDSTEEVLRLAAAVEQSSEHPLARAIVREAGRRGVAVRAATGFRALIGAGVVGSVAGQTIHVGNVALVGELGVDDSAAREQIRRYEGEGKTAVVVARDQSVIGVVALADTLRDNAARVVAELRALGVGRVVMLTGDAQLTAAAIAKAAGIAEVHARLLPDDKVRLVKQLSADGKVIFVGDGVNDAPALASATVGVAMGVAGTDAALEAADVALMGDDLDKLAVAVRMARKTIRIVKQNIGFSLAIKAVFLVLAVGGWATLWMAVAADMGGSLLVVANGLRARRR